MEILIIMILIILRHLSLLQPDTGIRPDLPPSPKKLNQHFATHKNISLIISPIFFLFPPKHEAFAHLVYSQGPF